MRNIQFTNDNFSFTNEKDTTNELDYFFSLISEKDLTNEIIDHFSLSYVKL